MALFLGKIGIVCYPLFVVVSIFILMKLGVTKKQIVDVAIPLIVTLLLVFAVKFCM